jgi:hypothetical protein
MIRHWGVRRKSLKNIRKMRFENDSVSVSTFHTTVQEKKEIIYGDLDYDLLGVSRMPSYCYDHWSHNCWKYIRNMRLLPNHSTFTSPHQRQ